MSNAAAMLALIDRKRVECGLKPLSPVKQARKPRGTGRVGAAKSAACAAIRERSTADVAVTIHVHTENPMNRGSGRNHWRVEADYRRKLHEATAVALFGLKPVKLPAIVKLTRVSPGDLDDDNLPPTLKAIRDEIAPWLGCDDDRKAPVTWQYDQRRERGEHRVEVLVRHVPAEGQKVHT